MLRYLYTNNYDRPARNGRPIACSRGTAAAEHEPFGPAFESAPVLTAKLQCRSGSMKFYLIVAKGSKQGLPIPITVDLFLIGSDKMCQLRKRSLGPKHCAFV